MEGDIKQKPKAASLSDEWEVATYFLFNDMLLQTKKKGKRYVVKSKNLLSTLQVCISLLTAQSLLLLSFVAYLTVW